MDKLYPKIESKVKVK